MDLLCCPWGCWWPASFWRYQWRGKVQLQPAQQWGLAWDRWQKALLGGTENVAEGPEKDGMVVVRPREAPCRSRRAAGQLWPCRSSQLCALCQSLQLPWPRHRGPCTCLSLHTSTQGLRLLQWFLQSRPYSQPPAPSGPMSPDGTAQVLMFGSRGQQLPPFCSSQPWFWQVGLWFQVQCWCLPWGCQLCPAPRQGAVLHPIFAGGHPGATHTSCACSGPHCSHSASPAPALTLLPACPQTP